MQFARNVQANWHEGYCFIMTMPHHIQPEQPRREFKNYSGNFLHIRLTARTSPLATSVWSAKNSPCYQGLADDEEVESEVRKWLRQRSNNFCATGFDALAKRWGKCINVGGGHAEKYFFFQFRISRLLSYISICDLFTDFPP
jgi:hypothetical protein